MVKFGIVLFTAIVLNAFPITLFYQGLLTDTAGKPLQVTDSIRVQLHKSTTSTTPLWQETHGITTNNGLFSILLGSISPIPLEPFLTNDTLYWDFYQKGRQKSSRTRVGINGFTIRSLYSDTSKTAKFLQGNLWKFIDTTKVYSNARLGVGTDSVTEPLTVHGNGLLENRNGNEELSILSSENSTLSFKGQLKDTVICRARITTNKSGNMVIDLSNGSGTAEIKSVITIKAGGDILSVAGGVSAAYFKANGTTLNVPDYVFQKEYELSPLSHVENYITEHHHLPDIPSAKEINSSAIDVVDLNLKLLKKIEEMTLYLIEQDKKIKALEQVISK